MFECCYVSSRIRIPQRNVTTQSCRRKALSIWRYCKRSIGNIRLVAPVTGSIVNTSRIPITKFLPALGPNVYFTQHRCPLPPFSHHHLHRTPSHTRVHSIQNGVAWHGQISRLIDILCSVGESVSTLQEPSVPVVQQLCHLVSQFILSLYQHAVSYCIVESMSTYCPRMRVSHHQNCPWHLSQQAHRLHPV